MAIGRAYEISMLGSTSIPTDTKKIAPNKFFTGSTKRIILSASMVSANMLPMTKAPKAELNPTLDETQAIAQQRPRATMSMVSLLISLRVWRRKVGMAKSPTTNHKIRKKPILNREPSICSPSGLLPDAIAESITIITIARMSSRISTLITSPAKRCCRNPMSSKAL